MIALSEAVRPSAGNNSDLGKEWNRAKAEYRESVERKIIKGEIKYSSARIFFALKSHSDSNYKPVYPSLRTLAKETCLSRKCVVAAIAELVAHEIVTIEKDECPRTGSARNTYLFSVKSDAWLPGGNRGWLPPGNRGWLPQGNQNSVQQNPVQENSVQQQPLSRNTPDPHADRSDIVVVLSEFFSKKDAIAIASWTEIGQYDPEYLCEKAALTTSKDRDNPLGFMRRALRDDYKPTIPAAKRRQIAREKKEAEERAERVAELRERDRLEAEKQKAGALLRQLTDTERSEIEAEARQILVKEGTTEDNPCYSIRLEAACEDIVLRRAS